MTQWATFEESTGYTNEKDLHTKGTGHRPGGGVIFWMFNPEIPQDATQCRVRCGMCKQSMDGHKSCPQCYPWRQEA